MNKTLCSLEAVVKQIKECIERQSEKNGLFFSRLSEHDIRLTRIEDTLEHKLGGNGTGGKQKTKE